MSVSRRFHIKSLLASIGLISCSGVSKAADSDLIGIWSGTLTVGATSLRLRFVITDAKTAKVISLDQGNAEIPASEVKLDGNKVVLGFKSIKARFEGELTDKDTLTGTFTQGAAIPLTLKRGETIAETPAAAAEPLTLALLQTLRTGAGTPALGAAAQVKGKAAVIIVNGARSSEDEIAVQSTDQWHWGSITKSMTATLVARLVEAGKVSWDTRVGSVFTKDINPAYLDATFRHLLSHRAGLQPNIDMFHLMGYSRDPLPDAREERKRYTLTALKQKPVGALAETMVYSNNGYIVAGAMLEDITGQSWETLIKAYVFEPLGLTSAGFGAPGRAGMIDQPLGHAVLGKTRKPAPVGPRIANDNPVALGPAGRVHMSLTDMLTYLSVHRDQPETFLKTASWQTLHTPPFGGDYAMGWVVRKDGVLWHNGSNTVWYCEVMVDPKAGVVCASAGNDAAPETQKAVSTALMSACAAVLP
ncbi:serine hydrolase domain-containing protein [Asticcacaulis machinosus]|uniref:Serine hydrolase n=1 Tax=Asticcacaulis machinosus TaxID=2984211 RepID=A0ABT5HLC4_9CAUL|nr:serine hydrolase domain-containing protein [Asticcacaulis machinosus]MDC7677044.1 serine hydrolase [Asticcacaulis machinosus]